MLRKGRWFGIAQQIFGGTAHGESHLVEHFLGWGEDGEALHRNIDASRWGVSKRDVAFLKQQVRQRLDAGALIPTIRDAFDVSDAMVGPNAYTVNEQYIKPLTLDAGRMSWALLVHPSGRQCDLFITHAWIEGIFEFIDKVLTSWPSGKRAAYICFLSNPQNLDISSLISQPADSPFARALVTATHVLVVPNRTSSVYTRLWCCYEAFLACQSEKIILTAETPIGKEWFNVILSLTVCSLMGFVLARFMHMDCSLGDFQLSWSRNCSLSMLPGSFGGIFTFRVSTLGLLGSLLIMSAFSYRVWCRRIYHLTGLCLFAFAACIDMRFFLNENVDHMIGWQLFEEFLFFLLKISPSCLLGTCLLSAEVEPLLSLGHQQSAEQLTHNFTGKIENADCTSINDKGNIFNEIGEKAKSVNQCVRVLVEAGMSTKNLRTAAEHGVSMVGVTSMSRTGTCAAWLAWVLLTCFVPYGCMFSSCSMQGIILRLISCICPPAWLIYVLRTEKDRRAFASNCMTKLVTPIVILKAFHHFCFDAVTTEDLEMPIWLVKWAGEALHYSDPLVGRNMPSIVVVGPLIFVLSVLSTGRVGQCPCCGRRLAQLISSTSVKTVVADCSCWAFKPAAVQEVELELCSARI